MTKQATCANPCFLYFLC